MKDLLAHLSDIERAIAGRGRVLIGCDFDGTLAPIADDPDSVTLSTAAYGALQRLVGISGVHVMVVSGRSLSDLRTRIGLPVVLAGNHGLEIEAPGWLFEHKQAALLRPLLNEVCALVRAALPCFPGAVLEDKGLTATVHYRLLQNGAEAELLNIVRWFVRPWRAEFELLGAKMAFEIRPKVDWDKGSAFALVRLQDGLQSAACISFGNDRTDESMFRRFPDGISVLVGNSILSSAHFRLRSADEVVAVLEHIAARLAPYPLCQSGPRSVSAGDSLLRRADPPIRSSSNTLSG